MPPGTASRRALGALPYLVAVGLAILFAGHETERFSRSFGPSHDGFNAALYVTGGRAIVEDGLVASRLGAMSRTVSGETVLYAHHPPFVYLASAAGLGAPGSVELAARLPAIVASLALLGVLTALLAACGLGPIAVAVGLMFAFATPMFLMFGAMTEPHALGLLPTAALTLLWQDARRGGVVGPRAIAVVGAAAALTSWLATLHGALLAGALLLRGRRRLALAVGAGIATGAILTGCWVLWAHGGDLGDFLDRALLRAGGDDTVPVGLRQAVFRQVDYLADLFPVGGWLVIPLAAIGLADRRTRPLVALSLGSVLGYAALFRNGAYDHSYWLYGVLLPLALGAGAAADAVSRAVAGRTPARAAAAVLASALGALLVVTATSPSDESRRNRSAAAFGTEARAVQWPPRQERAHHLFGGEGPTDLLPWVAFYSRRVPDGVAALDAVPRGELALRIVDGRLEVVEGEGPATVRATDRAQKGAGTGI